MELDLEELAAIVELLAEADFTEFRYEKGDLRIAVSRGGPVSGAVAGQASESDPAVATAGTPAAAPTAAPATSAATNSTDRATAQPHTAAPAPASDPVPESASDEDEVLVAAPMLGTLYRSPKPGEPPFVDVGDKVDADTVLCIVEVMKLMNSVPAGVAGEVTRILAGDGDLVQFEQPLFAIRPLS